MDKKSKRKLFKFLTICIAFCFTLLAAEIIFRVAENGYLGENVIELTSSVRVPSVTRHHGLFPMREELREVWGDQKIHYRTNSFGMRDSSVRIVKNIEPEKFRILFLGDSFTEGVGIDYDKIMVAQTGYKLKELLKSDKIECLNAGIMSYAPILEYMFLDELLRKGLKVDYVVIMVDSSDPQDEIVYGKHYTKKDSSTKPAAVKFNSSLFVNLYKYSALFRNAWHFYGEEVKKDKKLWKEGYYRDRNKWTSDQEMIETWGKKGMALMQKNMLRIVNRLNKESIPFSFGIYPWPYQIKNKMPISFHEKECRDFFIKEKLPFLNLYPEFRKLKKPGTYFIPNDMHWNQKGHEFTGKKLAKYLVNLPQFTEAFYSKFKINKTIK